MSTTFGWICTDPALYTMAGAMLDEEFEKSSMILNDTAPYRLGSIGALNVVITCLPPPPCALKAREMAINMAKAFQGLKAILLTDFLTRSQADSVGLGDLIISSTTSLYDHHPEPASASTTEIVHQAAHVLQREVGADGHWLSNNVSSAVSKFPDLAHVAYRAKSEGPDYPRLNYKNVESRNEDRQIDQQRNRLALTKNFKSSDTVPADLMHLHIPSIAIFGLANCLNSTDNDVWKWYAAANTASYAKELIQVMTSLLISDTAGLEYTHRIDSYKNELASTEKIIPPPLNPTLPPFQHHHYPSDGSSVLLVIPTENKSKRTLLEDTFTARAPDGVVVHTVTVPVDSGVGEQPYNEAGLIGAHNRISNALQRLDTVAEYQEILRVKCIGTVIVACVESFIQIDGLDRPADFGLVVIHNATRQETRTCVSCGVTVPPVYVDRARRYGFEGGDLNRGRVTVGQVLAAHVEGLDKADWQAVLAGRSRYQLLQDAVGQVEIPW